MGFLVSTTFLLLHANIIIKINRRYLIQHVSTSTGNLQVNSKRVFVLVYCTYKTAVSDLVCVLDCVVLDCVYWTVLYWTVCTGLCCIGLCCTGLCCIGLCVYWTVLYWAVCVLDCVVLGCVCTGLCCIGLCVYWTVLYWTVCVLDWVVLGCVCTGLCCIGLCCLCGGCFSRFVLFGSFVTVLCQQNGILVAVRLEVKCWFCLPRFYM